MRRRPAVLGVLALAAVVVLNLLFRCSHVGQEMKVNFRVPIGAIFALIGALLVSYGLLTGALSTGTAAGLNLDAWWGSVLALLGVGMLLLTWPQPIISLLLIPIMLLAAGATSPAEAARPRWSEQAAQAWYSKQPWFVGSNYIPASAINQLEMWQADTFDPNRIDLELGWAESLGMNTMRVFLHDLLWQQDSLGFTKRIDTFLTIANRHHIKTLFVLFDSVWDPSPHLGRQHAPVPGVHNSGWVQSPGAVSLADAGEYPRLKAYVTGVVGAFAQDIRILGWDIWNEPTIAGYSAGHWAGAEAAHKDKRVQALLPKAFEWARAANPIQPLTSGVWVFGASTRDHWPRIVQIQISQSDILSFHTYESPDEVRRRILFLQRFNRPIICTEYMARGNGSTFQNTMPILKEYHVGAINWGLVAGKTQTYFPWDSWEKPYLAGEPTPWFHDVFRTDGRPYDPEEVTFIRALLKADAGMGGAH